MERVLSLKISFAKLVEFKIWERKLKSEKIVCDIIGIERHEKHSVFPRERQFFADTFLLIVILS